jgi:septal ring factor EnvC (AmiA/AmiB activator)
VTHLLSDPKVIEAINGLVAVLIAGLGGAAAVGFARLKASMESHLQRATRAAEEAKAAAQSADAQVSNDHSSNIRDDIDAVRDTVKAVSETVDRVADTLDSHGDSLADMKGRLDRIDDRGGRMAAEIHDERTAREAAQRIIDTHAHDAHLAIYERIEALEARVEK